MSPGRLISISHTHDGFGLASNRAGYLLRPWEKLDPAGYMMIPYIPYILHPWLVIHSSLPLPPLGISANLP